MTLKVGITGGIGVGKSYCCRIFEVLGIPVYYADQRAKDLMRNNKTLKTKIIELFGEESYTIEGELNRPYLAERVFSSKENTQKMNQVAHPAVGMDLMEWLGQVEGPYGLYEAALIFESGSYQMLDKIIVVDAPDDIRIKRVMERDNINKENVLKRMAKQIPQSDKVAKADYIIHNDGSQSVVRQVVIIHAELIELAKGDINSQL